MSTKELRGTCKIAIGRSFQPTVFPRDHTREELLIQSALMGGLGLLRERALPLLTNRARTWLKWRERLIGAGILLLAIGVAVFIVCGCLAYAHGA